MSDRIISTMLWIGFLFYAFIHGTPSLHDVLMVAMDRFFNGG